jgi:hypothetical protein
MVEVAFGNLGRASSVSNDIFPTFCATSRAAEDAVGNTASLGFVATESVVPLNKIRLSRV